MELTLPLLGDVMTEGTVAKWLQADGAMVAEGAPLYELETDKVSLTVDAPSGGRLERVVAEGETVPVGAVVGRLLGVSALAAEPAGTESVAALAEPDVRADRPRVETAAVAAEPVGTEVRATPAARAAARRMGVDLRRLANGRRIREADVLQLAPAPGLSGRRKVIAERMRASLAQSAQVTVSMEADMTEALRLRAQLTQLVGEQRRPTITDLVIRATVLALREHPPLNATFDRGQLLSHPEVHMGVAVDTDDGLIVPVVHAASSLDLLALAQRTREVVERARKNQLTPGEVQGGTFTVTSLGPLGVDFFTPIINPPQVAILGVGRVFDKLVMSEGLVRERQSMYLNLSFDHQVVDGAPAARFLQSVIRFLELPAALVVETSR
jgi:pyruvate dehydrogenase E2 component (dihydrolipoamide acetyltransferase)